MINSDELTARFEELEAGWVTDLFREPPRCVAVPPPRYAEWPPTTRDEPSRASERHFEIPLPLAYALAAIVAVAAFSAGWVVGEAVGYARALIEACG